MSRTFSRAVPPGALAAAAPRLPATRPFGDPALEVTTSIDMSQACEHRERFGHSFSRLLTARSEEPASSRGQGREDPVSDVERPFPSPVRQRMEQLFKVDFSAVRLHEGEHADSFGARAVTRGNRIFFSRGQYAPESPAGQALLGHELTHVAQQQSGGVEVPQTKSSSVDQSSALESEADRAGAAVLRGESIQISGVTRPGTVQKDDWDTEEIYKAPDKVFGPSRSAVNYNNVADKLRKNPKSQIDPKHAVTMGTMISNVTNPKELENQKQPSDTNQEEWDNFITYYSEWEKEKPNRSKGRSFKKSSKAAVDYTVKKLGGNIHFVKGDLDWGKAADKRLEHGTTAADELRYIYRQREKIGGNVKFYENSGKQAAAPWEDEATKGEWEAYEERRQKKKQQKQ